MLPLGSVPSARDHHHRGYVGGPCFHDCRCDCPLIGHPRAFDLVLSVFSIFPVGPGCAQLGWLVEGGNEESCEGLGHLSGGGSNRGVALWLLFSAVVIVNESSMGCSQSLQLGVSA